MYDTFYRLRGNGFRLTPDYRLSFAHPSYAAALDSIAGAQQQGEGFVVLTGPPGTGKTTLVDELIARFTPTGIPIAKVANTQVTAEELLRLLAFAFNISAEGASKAALLQRLKRYLSERHVHGKSGLLIVDEAQDLDAPALEELRLITNFTIGSEPLVQVLLVGQDRLWDRLFCPELEQINQRIIATCRLKPLTAAQTRRYLAHRLRWVGWAGDPRISGPAIARIHEFTCGIPRRINSVMSRLLQYGADAELHVLDASHAEEVLRQLSEAQLRPHTPLPDPLGLNSPSSAPPLRPLGALTAAAMKKLEARTRKNSEDSNPHRTPLPPVGPQGQGDTTRVLSTIPWRLARRIPAMTLQKASKAWLGRPTWLAWQGPRDQATRTQAPSSTSPYPQQTVSLIPLPRTFKTWFRRVTPTLRRLHWRGAVGGAALLGLTLWVAVYSPLGPTTLAQEQTSPSFKSAADRPAREPRRLPPAAPRAPSGHSQSITNAAIKRPPIASGPTTTNAKKHTQGFVNAENPSATKPQPVKSDHESAGVSAIPTVDRSYPDHSSPPPLNAGPAPHRQPTAGGARSLAERKGDFSAYEVPPSLYAKTEALMLDQTAAEDPYHQPIDTLSDNTTVSSAVATIGASNALEGRPVRSAEAPATDIINRVREKLPEEKLAKPAVGNDPKSDSEGTTAKTKNVPQEPDATELLAAAQRAMRDYRLTLPPGDNAHMYFRAVLAKDPSNTAARIGLWRIVRTYQELARRKIEVDDLDAADRLVRRGLKVIPNANALLAVARELEELVALNELAEIESAGGALSDSTGVRESNEAGSY